MAELCRDAAQAEIMAKFRREGLGRDHQRFERDQYQRLLVGVEREIAPLLDQRARQGLHKQPLRQSHIERLAASLVAGFILRRQRQRHIGAGIGIFAQVLDGLPDTVARARIRQAQCDRRRIV